jgi:hypothetical protein
MDLFRRPGADVRRFPSFFPAAPRLNTALYEAHPHPHGVPADLSGTYHRLQLQLQRVGPPTPPPPPPSRAFLLWVGPLTHLPIYFCTQSVRAVLSRFCGFSPGPMSAPFYKTTRNSTKNPMPGPRFLFGLRRLFGFCFIAGPGASRRRGAQKHPQFLDFCFVRQSSRVSTAI